MLACRVVTKVISYAFHEICKRMTKRRDERPLMHKFVAELVVAIRNYLVLCVTSDGGLYRNGEHGLRKLVQKPAGIDWQAKLSWILTLRCTCCSVADDA